MDTGTTGIFTIIPATDGLARTRREDTNITKAVQLRGTTAAHPLFYMPRNTVSAQPGKFSIPSRRIRFFIRGGNI